MSSPRDHLTHAERAALGDTAGDRDRAALELVPGQFDDAGGRPRLTVEGLQRLLTFAGAIDGQRRGPLEVQAMFEILRDYAEADVAAAVREHARRSRFPVRTADIVELIEEEDLS